MNDLNKFQQKLLDMLAWFDDFCKRNKLTYYMVAGTMLGAVRHQGFIPWDDDVDVAMPRKDYDTFLTLSKNNDSVYSPESLLDGNSDFVYPFAKLYDTTTTLVENTRYKTKRGLYIDIFPLDGIGNTLEESIKNYKPIQRKINVISALVCALNHERAFYKNAAILLFRCFPKSICNHRKLLLSLEELCKSRPQEQFDYVGNLVGNWGQKEIMKKSIFGKPINYSFAGLQLWGVENADMYLKNLYGEYMKLPPKEKQRSHHDFVFCDLDMSYLHGRN